MKTLLNTAIITSALFATSAFAVNDLSQFGANSVESNLAAHTVATEQGFEAAVSPLTQLGASTEGHLSAQVDSAPTYNADSSVASFGLEVPSNSNEALL
ncbi:hypothetical protein [Neptunomonas sp. XY-337]|uniref:hypothetical protein n=1 Tax=Neptunomonas sp. XY-337 TaxID=2561897 RepID=UPI0010AAE234|nr:hypothetical protein [Neptunomonas sp. XY-337]